MEASSSVMGGSSCPIAIGGTTMKTGKVRTGIEDIVDSEDGAALGTGRGTAEASASGMLISGSKSG